MAEEKIQPGDTVKLKSGGPLMTVVTVEGTQAMCDWFGKDRVRKKDVFETVTLRKDDGSGEGAVVSF